jgi:hypothetical protein
MRRRSPTLAAGLRASLWLSTLAVLAGLGLLVAFHQVVQGVVDQAAGRRQAAALYADAGWRCRSMPDTALRPVLSGAGLVAEGRAPCRPLP